MTNITELGSTFEPQPASASDFLNFLKAAQVNTEQLEYNTLERLFAPQENCSVNAYEKPEQFILRIHHEGRRTKIDILQSHHRQLTVEQTAPCKWDSHAHPTPHISVINQIDAVKTDPHQGGWIGFVYGAQTLWISNNEGICQNLPTEDMPRKPEIRS